MRFEGVVSAAEMPAEAQKSLAGVKSGDYRPHGDGDQHHRDSEVMSQGRGGAGGEPMMKRKIRDDRDEPQQHPGYQRAQGADADRQCRQDENTRVGSKVGQRIFGFQYCIHI